MFACAVATVAVLAFGLWSFLFSSGIHSAKWLVKNWQQRAVMQWLQENEGDPDSVEIIRLEGPRYWGGDEWVMIKYRAAGPLGGPVVKIEALIIENGAAHYAVSRGEVVVRLWDTLDAESKFESMKPHLIGYARRFVENRIEDDRNGPWLKDWRMRGSNTGFQNPSVTESATHWTVSGPFRLNDQKTIRAKVVMPKDSDSREVVELMP